MGSSVIAYVDKTIVKISGLKVKGLKPYQLEDNLRNFIGRPIRVIGVTGESIEMDIYGIEPEAIYKDEQGFIKAVSTADGITAADVVKIDSAQKAIEVPIDKVPRGNSEGCIKERWINIGR
ncbi:hypothetical protein [Fonticella tunisiensis]|uniref:Uncharacterized protein n=1 Tax=Fonticella tunisiensis TaxID=1096341 RepID=A0A4R7KRA1_9CLOT|nr:hypothetical protein [Fonticella tunisiensis]TDT61902.1 hypothetical protein EDD71_10581 [Fonticella tunisiensis]